jgi:hypothetical protein
MLTPNQFEGSQTIPMLMETATIRERSKPGMEGQHFDRVPSRLMVCKAVHRIEPTIQFADDAFGHVTGSGQSGMQKMLSQAAEVSFQECQAILQVDPPKSWVRSNGLQKLLRFLKVSRVETTTHCLFEPLDLPPSPTAMAGLIAEIAVQPIPEMFDA